MLIRGELRSRFSGRLVGRNRKGQGIKAWELSQVWKGLLSSWVDGGRESCWDGDESPWAAGAGKDPLLFWAVRMGRAFFRFRFWCGANALWALAAGADGACRPDREGGRTWRLGCWVRSGGCRGLLEGKQGPCDYYLLRVYMLGVHLRKMWAAG